MGAIVIRTRYDEGTESAEVATSAPLHKHIEILRYVMVLYELLQ
jgi:hypothetical protein